MKILQKGVPVCVPFWCTWVYSSSLPGSKYRSTKKKNIPSHPNYSHSHKTKKIVSNIAVASIIILFITLLFFLQKNGTLDTT